MSIELKVTSVVPSYDEILELVRESNPSQDWKRVEHQDITMAVFKEDVNLRIEWSHDLFKTGIGCHRGYFREKWTTGFAEPHAMSYYYNLYYGSAKLESFILVHVDGGRGILPLPKSLEHLEVRRIDYKIAMIFDPNGDCEYYMSRAGLYLASEFKAGIGNYLDFTFPIYK